MPRADSLRIKLDTRSLPFLAGKMTLMAAFGCGLIAFGPVGVLFFLIVARNPLQVILFTLSAFFWLVGLLLSSVLWFAVVPLRDQLAFGLVFACLLQEVMRFLFYFLISKAESGLMKMVESETREAAGDSSSTSGSDLLPSAVKHASIFDYRALAFTSGLSFGLMGAVIEYVYILYDVVGPGTLLKGPNPGAYFTLAALDSCFMGLLQVAWSVILFRAYTLRRYLDIAAVVAFHVLLSALTLLNDRPSPAPELVCASLAVAVIVCYACAFFAAGGQLTLRSRSSSQAASPASSPPSTTTALNI